MNIYRIIFLALIILFLLEDYIKNYKKLYSYLKKIIFLVLILLVGCRGNLAADDQEYIRVFENFQYSFNFIRESRYEILYLVLNGLLKFFTNNFNFLFLIIAAMSLYNLYKYINFFSVSFFYSTIFYYCRWMFSKEFVQIRSGLACSFLYVAMIELYKENLKKYYLLILVGGLFHKAVFFALIYPMFLKLLNKKEVTWKKIIYILILIFPLIHIKKYLNDCLIKFGISSVYLTGFYSEKDTNITYYYSIIILIILIIFSKKLKKLFGKKYIFLEKSYIFSCLTSAILFHYGDLGGRLTSFFNTEFLLQDKLLSIFKNRLSLKIVLIFFLALLYYVSFTLRSELRYWNYFN